MPRVRAIGVTRDEIFCYPIERTKRTKMDAISWTAAAQSAK